MGKGPPGAGRSSFDLVDQKILFNELRLRQGICFLDLGCGRGEYTIAASQFIGNEGLLYGIDLWEEGIEALNERARAEGLKNITAWVGDVSRRIPLGNETIDTCLMATVLHDLVEIDAAEKTLDEVHRIMKPDGLLAVVEFKKIASPGPPVAIRLSPEDVDRVMGPHGFAKKRTVEVGPYHYLATFSVTALSSLFFETASRLDVV
jgi:ubiquinone/menaquinone biosynthesis C-methylase UbiE